MTISKAVLKEIGNIHIQGLSKINDGPIGINSLTAKILCREHNRALSDLDTAAATSFRIIREFQDSLEDGMPKTAARSELLSGSDLERWLLKVALGLVVSGQVALDGVAITEIRGNDADNMVKVLFGQPLWPAGWGLYVPVNVGGSISAMKTSDGSTSELGIVPMSNAAAGELWALVVQFRSIPLELCLGVPDHLSADVYRPSALRMSRKDVGDLPQELRLSWQEGLQTHRPVDFIRAGTVGKP